MILKILSHTLCWLTLHAFYSSPIPCQFNHGSANIYWPTDERTWQILIVLFSSVTSELTASPHTATEWRVATFDWRCWSRGPNNEPMFWDGTLWSLDWQLCGRWKISSKTNHSCFTIQDRIPVVPKLRNKKCWKIHFLHLQKHLRYQLCISKHPYLETSLIRPILIISESIIIFY